MVSYDYDAGLPVKEYANGIPVVTGVGYQASGALSGYTTGMNVGHNVTATIGQDGWLPRPSSISTSGATANFVSGSYSYDGAGNVMGIGADSFSYDLLSRLSSASLSGAGSQSFSYDQYGNLLTKGGTTFCTGTCTNNQVTGGTFLRGNLTSYGGQTFAWDGLDRMTSSTQSSMTWNYLYDGSDERAAKIPPTGSWTYTVRDESKRVESEFSGATPSRDNIFLGNQLVASYANAAVGGNGPTWLFYASDHLGTPRLLTDLSGATVESRKYWPFGEAVPTQGTFEALRFATMEFDAEGGTSAGLASDRYYDHARSHVGGLGRFLEPDRVEAKSLNPQTWNRYAYARNNPLRFNDPNGLVEVEVTIRHFIQQPSVLSPFGRLHGDNRGFSLNPKLGSRTEQQIVVETDPSKRFNPLISKEKVTGPTLNRTTGLEGHATGSSMTVDVSRAPDDSVLIKASQNEEVPRSATFGIGTFGNGIASNVTISIDPSGSEISAWGDRSSFPSLEINVSEWGQSFSLYRGDQSSSPFGLFSSTSFAADCVGAPEATCSQTERK